MELPPFESFPKIPRWSREIIITEKIDGTNACVWVSDDGTELHAASKNKWITPENDNFGFARWVAANRDELLKLGPGKHYGEWYGQGIQCGYGLKEKRFALFNVSRWGDATTRPACCGVVPLLYKGPADNLDSTLDLCLGALRSEGSVAVPGWLHPEGIIIFHTAGGHLYKKTLENDHQPKGSR